MAAPMWPEEPEITRCDACGAYFWLDQAPKVAVAEPIFEYYDAEGRRVRRNAGEWDVPYVRFLTPREHRQTAGEAKRKDPAPRQGRGWPAYSSRPLNLPR